MLQPPWSCPVAEPCSSTRELKVAPQTLLAQDFLLQGKKRCVPTTLTPIPRCTTDDKDCLSACRLAWFLIASPSCLGRHSELCWSRSSNSEPAAHRHCTSAMRPQVFSVWLRQWLGDAVHVAHICAVVQFSVSWSRGLCIACHRRCKSAAAQVPKRSSDHATQNM